MPVKIVANCPCPFCMHPAQYYRPFDLLNHRTNQLKPSTNVQYEQFLARIYIETRTICFCLPHPEGTSISTYVATFLIDVLHCYTNTAASLGDIKGYNRASLCAALFMLILRLLTSCGTARNPCWLCGSPHTPVKHYEVGSKKSAFRRTGIPR